MIKAFLKFRKERVESLKFYPASLEKKDNRVFFLIREDNQKKLVILGKRFQDYECEESGRLKFRGHSFCYQICPCSSSNSAKLRAEFKWLRPRRAGTKPTIGMGDRLGLATAGHIESLKGERVFPVLAQQSVREMTRTQRTPRGVIDDVTWGVFQKGHKAGWGADADHLKTEQAIDAFFKAGFSMYTIDPSDLIKEPKIREVGTLEREFENLPLKELGWSRKYLDRYVRKFDLHGLGIERRESLLRLAVKYSRVLIHVAKLHARLRKLFGKRGFDLEISMDETETPTSPEEHFFVASELRRLGVRFHGIAPRFVGTFEKAIDYIGNLKEFERAFRSHVSIARYFGHKLSIHSGSDKHSIYPILSEARELIHLKTSGTSYLEALRLVARHEPELFREIIQHSLGHYESDKREYQVGTRLAELPKLEEVGDDQLERKFLDERAGRQLLHVTFGSVLTAKDARGEWLFRERVKAILAAHEEEYQRVLAAHFKRHLRAFRAGKVPKHLGF